MGEQRRIELLCNLQNSVSLWAVRIVTIIGMPFQPPQTIILNACAKKVGCLFSPWIDACEGYYSFRMPLFDVCQVLVPFQYLFIVFPYAYTVVEE